MSSPDDLMLSEHKRIENGDMPQQGKVFFGRGGSSVCKVMCFFKGRGGGNPPQFVK